MVTDVADAVYAPSLIAQFSEALDAATVTTQTVTVKTDAGTPVAVDVAYDGRVNRVVVTLTEPWRLDTTYTAMLGSSQSPAIRDASGNRLPEDFSGPSAAPAPSSGRFTYPRL